jgi:hypothetical protein
MIRLYRNKKCSLCDDIEDKLREMVIHFQSILVEEQQYPPEILGVSSLPIIKDSDEIITGEKNIKEYIERLKDFVSEWRRFQGDSCYLDENGEVC